MNFLSRLKQSLSENEGVRALLSAIVYRFSGNKTRVKGRNNRIQRRGVFIRRSSILIRGNDNTVVLGPRTRLTRSKIYVTGDHHRLILGGSCFIEGTELCMDDHHCLMRFGDKAMCLGAYVQVSEPYSSITLGDGTGLSYGVDVRNGDSHSILDRTTGKRINYAKDIVIGNHVWVAKGVTILKGAHIGDEAIIGTRAVVTGDIPDHCVAVGIPAKVIRTNVLWKWARVYDEGFHPPRISPDPVLEAEPGPEEAAGS